MSAKWQTSDVVNNVELVGKERHCQEDNNIDKLDDPDNKVEGPEEMPILRAIDDKGQISANTDACYESEFKSNKGTHVIDVEYMNFCRICCAAKAACEADIETPGIDHQGCVDDEFVDYLQQHREFDVRKTINMCGTQPVSLDEDILCNLHTYLQLYTDYLAQKNGGSDVHRAEQFSNTENKFKTYLQLFNIFSAAKLLSEEGQEIPGVDKHGFVDDGFVDYLQQFREFNVRKVINDCSFSRPTHNVFIANNVSHYTQEYLRLHDEYQAFLSAL